MGWGAHSVERSEVTHSERFNAPLFRSLVLELETRERSIVLDLGAARTQTIELFGRYGCRLDIANVADRLTTLNAISDPERLRDAAEALLPARSAEATDVVLCWDLLNYLERPALHAVMSSITERARRGTLVHALIIYSQPHMPVEPGSYIPDETNSLLDIAVHSGDRPAPRYSPEDLSQSLPEFWIDRAMLLGNGMQEFLFRCTKK